MDKKLAEKKFEELEEVTDKVIDTIVLLNKICNSDFASDWLAICTF